MSGNVELNPGPVKKCPKCKKMMPTRSNNCKCGYLLCYIVAVRVLHFRDLVHSFLKVMYIKTSNYYIISIMV